jgi:hypothetical protein
MEHRSSDRNPAETSVRGSYALTQELKDRTIRFEQEVQFSSDLASFRLQITRRVFENGELLHEKEWDQLIPRDFQ